MFASAANPYDELIVKATDENLASEDWALNLEVCDKVTSEGQTGSVDYLPSVKDADRSPPRARNAIGALQKRLSHRNPNVQLYALELANTLAQNCGKPLLEELSSRNWTSALDRLVNDRATAAPVKKKALGYIKAWAKQFEGTGDPNLGLMGELYDQLRAKNLTFDEPEAPPESREDARRRQEEADLARVLELSKQDKGGRAGAQTYQPSVPSVGASSSSAPAAAHPATSSAPPPRSSYVPPPPEPEPETLDINAATRVRALYTFTSAEVGELNFERGDVIKVLDRGFKEWWRGACNGRIGIFPVTYVEAMPEPTPQELQEEAQEEARVFASLGLVDQLLQTLKDIDPSRGDRLDDKPEIEEMYQASVGLQGQINALIKKYSDQKAELEHMNANFLRAMRQYEELRNPAGPPPGQYGYAPQADSHAGQYPQYNQQPQNPQQNPQQQYAQQPRVNSYTQQPSQQTFPHPEPYPGSQPGQPYQQMPSGGTPGAQLQRAPTGAPDFPPAGRQRQATQPGAAGLGSGANPQDEHAAAWEAYYRQQAEEQQRSRQSSYETAPQGQPAYGASPYPPQDQGQRPPNYGGPPSGVDGVASGMNRMTVNGQ